MLVKKTAGGRIYSIEQDGVSLAGMAMDADQFIRAMVSSISSESYRLHPAQSRKIRVNGKERELFAFRPTDLILHGVIAELILELLEPAFSPHLYSYRKGKNWWIALSTFARFVRFHRRAISDPQRRGLYVMRRDIRKYTDTIPVGENSPIWSQLRGLLGVERPASSREEYFWNLVVGVVRPEITARNAAGLATKFCGVPTGSPISTALFNAYLHPIDKLFDNLDGAFYARYADDVIFAHPDPNIVQSVAQQFETALNSLHLTTNSEKGSDSFFNGAGRLAPNGNLPGTQTVQFLGCLIKFDGTISLVPTKVNHLLVTLKNRITTALLASSNPSLDSRTALAVRLANQALDPSNGLPHKTAELLASGVTDRRQLADIDHRIALLIATTVTGISGPRAFRSVPYSALRSRWKLVSLEHQRNS